MRCENEKNDVLNIYRSHKPDIHLYPGVADMIKALDEKGIKVGIITDGRPEGQRNKYSLPYNGNEVETSV